MGARERPLLGERIVSCYIRAAGSCVENQAHVNRLRDNVWIKRKLFTFDYQSDQLVEFSARLFRRNDRRVSFHGFQL